MISTLLADHPWLPTAALVALLLTGAPLGAVLARRRRFTAGLLAGSLAGMLLLTFAPTHASPLPGCTVTPRIPDLLAPEPLANVLLFAVPVALAVLVSRRPGAGALLGVAGGTLLSAGIEIVQAVSPALGRSCDSGDWIANTAGALVGAALGSAGLLLARTLAARSARMSPPQSSAAVHDAEPART